MLSKQFFKFSIVGLFNTGLDFGFFTLLSLLGLPLPATQSIAYTCGVINSYLVNRKWTFKQQGQNTGELIKFFLLNLLTLLITYGLLALLHEYMGVNLFVSKILVTGAGFIVNYLGSRCWVFRENKRVLQKVKLQEG